MITALPIPATPYSKCQAKDPANCRYHGAYKRLETAYSDLSKGIAQDPQLWNNGALLEEYFQARQEAEKVEKEGWVEGQQKPVTPFKPSSIKKALKQMGYDLHSFADHVAEGSGGDKIKINGIDYDVEKVTYWEGKPNELSELIFRVGKREFQLMGKNAPWNPRSTNLWDYDTLEELRVD